MRNNKHSLYAREDELERAVDLEVQVIYLACETKTFGVVDTDCTVILDPPHTLCHPQMLRQ